MWSVVKGIPSFTYNFPLFNQIILALLKFLFQPLHAFHGGYSNAALNFCTVHLFLENLTVYLKAISVSSLKVNFHKLKKI